MLKGGTSIRTRGSPIMEDRNHYYCPITGVEAKPYTGLVHNFETKQRNYCINNAVSHNSIRRTLVTELKENHSSIAVSSFLRWKQRTSSDMVYRYSSQTYVGKNGESTKVVGEAQETDKKIFKNHPFLEYWG